MCTLCSQIAPIASDCVLGGEPPVAPMANIFEGADAASSTGNGAGYTIDPGDSFSGALDFVGDRDWVAVDLDAGTSYFADVFGASQPDLTLVDTFLRIFDDAGNEVARNDDAFGLESHVEFTAGYSGTHYVEVGSYLDRETGTYDLVVGDVDGSTGPIGPAPGVGTIDEMAEYLTDGYWNGTGFSSFAFGDGNITVNLTGLTAEGRQLARWAMEAWEMVADLDFTETSGAAEITFQDHESGAFGGPDSVINGVNSESTVNVSTDWLASYGTGIDSYSLSTYIHEIGHALGLGHQGPYDGNALYGSDQLFTNDSWQMSVMSYFDQNHNTSTAASYAALVSAMMVDIVAIQNLYGAPGSNGVTAGDTTWGANTTLDNYMGTYFDIMAGGNVPSGFLTENEDVAFTLYDQGGTDTIDLRFSDTDNFISMLDGTFSNIEGRIGNVGIAVNTVIENLVAGSGDDIVMGNDADNIIGLRDGNDRVEAEAGEDLVFGGAGSDFVRGNAGEDTLYGGGGNDTVYGGADNDLAYGGGGDDVIGGGAGDDRLGGAAGNDEMYGGGGGDRAFGSVGRDRVFGGAGNDELYGGDDNDGVFGGTGNDTIFGGSGDDRVFGAVGGDRLAGGGGDDLLGGREGNDTLLGGAGDDRMLGGDDSDVLDGGSGDDFVAGGDGADIFIFGAGDDDDTFNTFDTSEDTLRLDDALWSGNLSAADIVSQFASVNAAGNVVFDFGADSFELLGVTSLAGLSGAIDIV